MSRETFDDDFSAPTYAILDRTYEDGALITKVVLGGEYQEFAFDAREYRRCQDLADKPDVPETELPWPK